MSVGAVNKNTGDRIPTAGMPAIDDALDLTSVNPVQNAVITAALALKQDKTDNSLQTTDKTVVGAINEHEGDIGSLKSGLTNVGVALSVPDGTGKNMLPMLLSDIKRCNTYGTWADNVYTYNGITFTVNLDSNGDISSIKATGTASAKADFIIADNNTPNIKAINGKIVTLNGCPANGSSATYSINGWQVSTTASSARDTGSGVTFNAINMSSSFNFAVSIANGYEIATTGLLFYPMVRLSSVSDPTFAPYIPSVESRIEAVEEFLPTAVNVTLDPNVEGAIDDAKVFRFGKLIVGNIRVTLNNTVIGGSPIIHGLPKINTSLAAFSSLCPVTTNKTDVACTIFNEQFNNASLGVATGVTAGTGVLMLSFSYVSV